MESKTLKQIAKKMWQLDFCMMFTLDGRGRQFSRPMSNNGDVEFDGNSWFFTYEQSDKVKQIESNPSVSLSFQTEEMLFIHLYGIAKIIKQKSMLAEHWQDSLKMWFPEGIETPGIVMLKVEAKKIQYWHKEDEGEWKL